MRAGYFLGDGKPEAGTALASGPRRIDAVKGLEEMRQVLAGPAGTGIGYQHIDMTVLPSGAERDAAPPGR